jgi:hypothetical protein
MKEDNVSKVYEIFIIVQGKQEGVELEIKFLEKSEFNIS